MLLLSLFQFAAHRALELLALDELVLAEQFFHLLQLFDLGVLFANKLELHRIFLYLLDGFRLQQLLIDLLVEFLKEKLVSLRDRLPQQMGVLVLFAHLLLFLACEDFCTIFN